MEKLTGRFGVDGEEHDAWEFAVGLGLPDATGPGSLDCEGIHPVALLLEDSAHRVRGVNRIPCYTAFGPVIEFDEFAQRAWPDTYDRAGVPVECRLAVYVTDDELDDLVQAVAADLGVDKDGYSTVVGRKVTIGLRPISLESPENSVYQHLVDQYRNLAETD
ncbi:hypothetical protein IU500_19075 [Nocardia terpenica]|uniref:hypothetical protein n=1 Tax=Nocardia terpenica TaxID=455432 RepID=UPI0018941792|nr:hypothetical protein [Nocardia terpenica]MBF6062057.1 hypothetical protein [Nocardia terpenica]MBF6106143.1 hypothetical protein [Nocardia terpenica]MBF6110477.1 hypothetical protein [Nocardia terpenica]MBF6120686.1 hypothetical protein [Nocardia terpenica]MBF6151813.1 hypothetical protein [Nocardia terpenica]